MYNSRQARYRDGRTVGRYDVYRLNETLGARRWYAQRNQSFADGPTPPRFQWRYWCLAGNCDGINLCRGNGVQYWESFWALERTLGPNFV